MTVLRLDVELPYPVELVWQALTDRRLLGEWFLQTDLMPVPGGVYRAFPAADLPGFTAPFDMDVIEVVGPTRLALRWRGEQLHADVVWELSTVVGGSRLRVSQTGFLGIAGQVRRAELQRAYATMFEQRLPALLARQEQAALPARRRRSTDIYDAADMPRRPAAVVTASAATGHARQAAEPSAAGLDPGSRAPVGLASPTPATAVLDPRTPPVVSFEPAFLLGDDEAWDARPPSGGLLGRVFHMPVDRRMRLLSAAGAMVLTVLAVTAVATLVLRSPGPAAQPLESDRGPWSGVQAGESATPSPAAVSAGPVAAPSTSAAASPSGAASVPGGPAPTGAGGSTLAVSYRTLETWSGGYIGEITFRPAAAVDGWSAVVRLPAGAQVTSAWDRIGFRQDGRRVTFTPQAVHRELPAGQDFVFAFQVGDPSGATRPETCAVEGVSCANR
ncbi:cellulose binding domain-containing protein [Catellatospora vulcania]|uniref:cellulose binding domain-containing protein n=1 Tax=Catellatospora vulcania TaxID=1460450 RepID=UPI0012D3DB8F|nr:SRPBCC domain-containing protein [Catellatospora vulcania]